MGKRIKRIQKDIRMGWMLKSAAAAAVTAAIVWLVLLGMHAGTSSGIFMAGCLVLLLLAALIGWIIGFFKGGKMRKHAGGNLDGDVFEKAGDTFWLGQDWLVYRFKEEWIVWPRTQVLRISMRDHNALGTRADITVYEKGRMYGQTFHINGTSYDMLHRLEDWARME